MRIVAGILCLAFGGCSLAMTPLAPNYDERTIPRCETDGIYPLGDALVAVAAAGGSVAIAVAGHDASDGSSKWIGVAGLGIVALAFTGASIGGFRWDSRCTAAKKQWDQRQIEQDTLVQESKQKARVDAVKQTPVQTAPPRGFYCSNSTASVAGFCMREKAECERTRDATAVAVADLTSCTLVETAWCFADRCAPTHDICEEMLKHTQGTVSECTETK